MKDINVTAIELVNDIKKTIIFNKLQEDDLDEALINEANLNTLLNAADQIKSNLISKKKNLS